MRKLITLLTLTTALVGLPGATPEAAANPQPRVVRTYYVPPPAYYLPRPVYPAGGYYFPPAVPAYPTYGYSYGWSPGYYPPAYRSYAGSYWYGPGYYRYSYRVW